MHFARLESRMQSWESKNNQELTRLIGSLQVFVFWIVARAVKWGGIVLYLVYQVMKIGVLLLRSLWIGPVLIQRVSPQHRPLERHEFDSVGLGVLPRSWHG